MEISNQAGQWLVWIGIICAVVAFFWQPVWMSVIAIVLGMIGLFSGQKNLNWAAIIIGVIALIVYYI
ncbi:C4-dicarboxylate ABC transporter [Suicoccus acidiformans]|uniref:C4-dicarboxylate ABC transporter n=1 Tax=Suicoccus acidiformans TaxID=2036206 RepID=UPI0013C2E86F|nr:C4-dicarboxylate ABC transporter [Suicoccus acidiformans]